MKIAQVQLLVKDTTKESLSSLKKILSNEVHKDVDLIMLPEMFSCPYEAKNFPLYAEKEGGPLYKELAQIAKEYGAYLVAGSVAERCGLCICFDMSPGPAQNLSASYHSYANSLIATPFGSIRL